jgi:hypothetical protein
MVLDMNIHKYNNITTGNSGRNIAVSDSHVNQIQNSFVNNGPDVSQENRTEKLNIIGDSIEIKMSELLNGSFFEALLSSQMNTDIDLEAYSALVLSTIKINDFEKLQDKYLLTNLNIIRFAQNIISKFTKSEITMSDCIKFKNYDLICDKIKHHTWDSFLNTEIECIIDMQISNFLDINLTDYYDNTMLNHMCKQSNDTEIIRKIIQNKKCDPFKTDSCGKFAFYYCVERNFFDISFEIIKNFDCDWNNILHDKTYYRLSILEIMIDLKMNDCIIEIIKKDKCIFYRHHLDGMIFRNMSSCIMEILRMKNKKNIGNFYYELNGWSPLKSLISNKNMKKCLYEFIENYEVSFENEPKKDFPTFNELKRNNFIINSADDSWDIYHVICEWEKYGFLISYNGILYHINNKNNFADIVKHGLPFSNNNIMKQKYYCNEINKK